MSERLTGVLEPSAHSRPQPIVLDLFTATFFGCRVQPVHMPSLDLFVQILLHGLALGLAFGLLECWEEQWKDMSNVGGGVVGILVSQLIVILAGPKTKIHDSLQRLW